MARVLLVTPEYVASTTGADVSDTDTVELLIGEASALVMDHLGRAFTPETAPVAVRQAVAVLVAGALPSADGDVPGPSAGDIKAEQVGDYRVEFAGAGRYAPGLDIRRVAHLLALVRGGGRSVVTDIPFDGIVESDDPLAGVLVVNR